MEKHLSGSLGRPFFMPDYPVRLRWIVRLFAVTLLFFISIIVNLMAVESGLFTSAPLALTPQVNAIQQPDAGLAGPTTGSNGGSAADNPVPQCRRTANSPRPVPLSVNATDNRVGQLVDAPQYYPVYGNDGAEVWSQIAACSPVVQDGTTYAATTNYSLNWAFNFTSDGSICQVTDAAVGIHVTQLYPDWQQTAGATSGFIMQWQSFMANLRTHENGHRDLDVSYAERIFSMIKNYPPTDCTVISTRINASASALVTGMQSADKAYDQSTGHGQTQGAVLAR